MARRRHMRDGERLPSTPTPSSTTTSPGMSATSLQRARLDPTGLSSADVMQLQRQIGNRAVGRLLQASRDSSHLIQKVSDRQIVQLARYSQAGGKALTEKKGRELLGRISQSDMTALEEVNAEGAEGKRLGTVEWGLGRDKDDGSFHLITGAATNVTWDDTGLIPLAHSHPQRELEQSLSLDDLVTRKNFIANWLILPTGDDLYVTYAMAGEQPFHQVFTPYVYFQAPGTQEWRIGDQSQAKGNDTAQPLSFEIAQPEKLYGGWYGCQLTTKAGGTTLDTREAWGRKTNQPLTFNKPADASRDHYLERLNEMESNLKAPREEKSTPEPTLEGTNASVQDTPVDVSTVKKKKDKKKSNKHCIIC